MEDNSLTQEKDEIMTEPEQDDNFSGEAPARRKIPRWVFFVDAALIVAAVVAIVLSSFWSALGGKANLADGIDTAEGKLATFSVGMAYGYYAERYSTATDDASGRYYLCSLDGEPMTILVSKSGFENASQLRTESVQHILGRRSSPTAKISGEGYVRQLTEAELDEAYAWFENNKSMFDESIVDASDAATIIGTHVLVMDYIGSVSAKTSGLLVNLAVALVALALILPVLSLLPVGKRELEAAGEPLDEDEDDDETGGDDETEDEEDDDIAEEASEPDEPEESEEQEDTDA